MLIYLIVAIQLIFSSITTWYFISLIRNKNADRSAMEKESIKELAQIKAMRENALTVPLSEQVRPKTLDDIVGQKNGIKALRAALCSSNPQHVIIYGPPGVGKTAAARVVLEEAKLIPYTPFKNTAKCVEIDATTLRYDERGIADPLIGSVHDPIYQGAGAYGTCGVPQPKPGAVTKANGGILFIDEIGEMPLMQLNKLLKVLEDRKVMLESAYYSSFDKNIPVHIHDVFKNGLPADFRLVAATTRSPEEIPEAIKSRCVAVYFDSLSESELVDIAIGAGRKNGFVFERPVAKRIANYATNGRECVNIVQSAIGVAMLENRKNITVADIEWVAENGRYVQKISETVKQTEKIGSVNGIAVFGSSYGKLINIEVTVVSGNGKVTVTGISDKEEAKYNNRCISGKSSGRCSVSNVISVLSSLYGITLSEKDVHINIPGGSMVDGPSAGAAIFCAVYSEVNKIAISTEIAITGELSIKGEICPVGSVTQKIDTAIKAGVKKIYVPKDNWLEKYNKYNAEIIPVKNIIELTDSIFEIKNKYNAINNPEIIVAEGI